MVTISNLVELLRLRATVQPERRAFTFLGDGETQTAASTYAELDQQGRSIGAAIQQKTQPGDRVLLLYPQGLEYIAAFFGCLYAGTIAVPAYPPRRKRASSRLQAIVADCEASLVLTSSAIAQALRQTGDLAQVPWVITEELPLGGEDDWREPEVTSESLAFIQYTSGSTGLPKGVMLSHGNLIHNERMIQAAFEQTAESIVAGWLPMYHDMGLIGNVLQPVYSGSHCVLMSPVHFLQRPLRWLQAISQYKATTSGGPNFAYDLCVRKISAEQAAQLDLSTWSVAFNGAEPIRHGTLERFASHFESSGFRSDAFRPCYGLAEATLLVSMAGGPRVIDDGDTRSLVSSGQTILDQKIAIVDPETLTECAPGETGEIWISSRSVAQGYWNQPEETERVFRAHLANGDGPFLRTEDLGLMRDGELYVTGRLKDLIIIRGRNHYPQDIEQAVEESHPALRPGCGAAFSVDANDEERLVVVQEIDRHRDSEAAAAIAAIRDAVTERHDLQVYAVVLIGAGTLPKTTSGKVQRRACKQLFVEDRLDVRAKSVFEIDLTEIDLNQPLTNYGIDSLTSLQIQHEIEMRTGRRIPLSTLYELSRSEYALSYGQRAIWFLQRMDPESCVYNIARAIEIFEDIDVNALRRSLQQLVNRHPVLRTTFRESGDQVVQQITDGVEVAFTYEPAPADLTERLASEAQRPFDLQEGPLLRVFVFQRGPRDYLLLFVIHHIVADLWSLALLFDELWQVYHTGQTDTLNTATPFSSYVSWQQQLLGSADGARLKSYWANQLAGELPVTRLMNSAKRTTETAERLAYEFDLDQATTESLRQIAQAENTTLYVVLLATLFNLLSRYTRQSDLVVGSIASGRTRAEFAHTAGFFANAIVIRDQLESTRTFTSWVQRMAHTVSEALQHQEYPFALLVEDLQPVREAGTSPLFDILFNYQRSPRREQHALSSLFLGSTGRKVVFNGMTVQPLGLPVRQGPFNLSISMADDDTGLAGVIEFQTDVFETALIERFGRHFKTMLEGVAANPNARLADLPLLTPDDVALLDTWNLTHNAHAPGQRIHDLFEAQVRRTPENTALIAGRQQLSYSDLNARANRLAHHLQSLGVGPETLVGVFMDRSADLVVTLLAILKAGGAYLTLDLNYPPERLALMSADTRLALVVTRSQFLPQLPPAIKHVLCVDESAVEIDRYSAENPASGATDLNMAYMIYTSGSTGRPHGIAIEHRNTVALLCWCEGVFDAGELACVLASTSLCFDISVFEIFAPLSSGGAVVLVENAMHLIDLPPSINITLINAVPSAIEQVLRFRNLPPSVRTVNLAGEPLTRKLVDKLYANPGVQRVYNLYGPSEDTTYSTFTLVEKDDDQAPLIGKPIDNTRLYILDPHMNRVPPGVPGELCLAGEGIARGYINSPDLTATRFVPNPFADVRGDRLYKTGDLARFREDGNVEFLGRLDFQVKVRGYRIELGEIESQLLAQRGVSEAVVVVRPDRTGERCLVAYLVPNNADELKVADVRARLQEKLPAYLVPSFFVVLETLPHLPNGKINRSALPAPDAGATWSDPGVLPRTELERAVAAVWEEVLQRRNIGVEQNFFELGGTSFKALDVLRRLEQTFHRRILVNDLFKYTTVGSLARFLADEDDSSTSVRRAQSRAETQKRALERIARARSTV